MAGTLEMNFPLWTPRSVNATALLVNLLSVSITLDNLCGHNYWTPNQNISVFDSVHVPDTTIKSYVTRLADYPSHSFLNKAECLVIGVIYLDRYCQTQSIILTRQNVHRLYATSLLIAIKIYDDHPISNKAFAQTAGIKFGELNVLEETFLKGIKFGLYKLVSPNEVLPQNNTNSCHIQ